MNGSSLKTGILVFLLIVPAFLFLFVKLFGHNNFDLPYYFPKINEQGEVSVVKGDTVFCKQPIFKLINENDSLVNNANNNIKVVNFFFSRCGTICPVSMQNLKRISDNFINEPKVHLYSISVDPVFDKPNVLKTYKSKYTENANWDFLTGDKKYIYELAIKDFKLPVADAKQYSKEVKGIDEQFIHSDKALLIDSQGYFRGIYSSTNKDEIDRLMVEIKILLKK